MSRDTAEQGECDDRSEVRNGYGHLIVVQATRADALADDLAQRMAAIDYENPLDECIVVLQGAGMHRWLRREMAYRLGAWGGVETPFLRKFLFDITARAASAPVATASRQDIGELAYRIAAHVERAVARGGTLDRIEPFVAASRDAAGALSMETLLTHSHTLAESFDRYEMDRPDMIAAWDSRDGPWVDPSDKWSAAAVEAESWQRALWRQVVPGTWHAHEAWKQFYALIKSLEGGSCPEVLKSIRFVSVFGVSSLPPSVFAFLEALARHIPVHVHMLVPTEALIENGASDRKIAKHAARTGTDIATFRAAHKRDERNALRATLGTAAVEAAQVIDSLARVEDIVCECAAAQPTTLLAAVQEALRQDLPARDVPVIGAATPDASLQFHAVSCAARAGEVVHDEILRACADFPGLPQEEIAILVPSLPSYGAAIEVVFAQRAAEMPANSRLSLHSADAAASDQSPLATAALAMMTLVTEDAAFAQVGALLSSAVVCQAMGHEVDQVRQQLDLLAYAGAARFFDAAHRRRWLGKRDPTDDELHTIAWAIDRVVLGTVAGDSPARSQAIGSCLASERIAPQAMDVFHAIGTRIEALQTFAELITQGAQTIDAWAQQFSRLCDLFLPDASDAQWGEQRVRLGSALATIAQRGQRADLPAVEFAVARGEFAKEFADIADGQRFASGGVTLAQLSPMRSVPFRFIALVGIDRGLFPRPFKSNGMDLESLSPRAGDRNPRNDDLLLLLESIHAATDRLVVVYEGIEASTVRAKPPSPLVDQLLESCAGHLGISVAQAKTRLCRSHTPMADQPEAWQGDAPAGFNVQARARAERIAVARTQGSARSFMDSPGSAKVTGATATATATTSSRGEIPSIHEMGSVLKDPVRAFLKASGLQPADVGDMIGAVREPIELDPRGDALKLWGIRQRAVDRFVQGGDAAVIREELRLGGDLPHGASRSIAWKDIAIWAQGAHDGVEACLSNAGAPLPAGWKCLPFTFDVTGSEPRIVCETLRIESVSTQILIMRAGKTGEILPLWLEHLAWCATHPNARSIRIALPVERTADAVLLDSVDPELAAQIINEIGAWARAALIELMPFNGKLLHPWIGGPTQRLKQTPADQLARAEAAFEKDLGFDRNMPLAFRGQNFFGYASQGANAQTFEAIAAWLAERLKQTGWEK